MNIAIDAGIVAFVVALVEAAKLSGLPTKYAPLASLGFGIAYSVAFVTPGTHIARAVVEGIAIGLTASGLYSGVKTMAARNPKKSPITEQE